MFRALAGKEWRQLRTLRWFGLGLGAAIVLLLPAAVAWGTTGYGARDAFADLAPWAIVAGLWPLMALLAGVQAFAGDRAAGTETFLLERPVSRSTVWWARLLAALGSTLFVGLGGAALWVALGPAWGLASGHYEDLQELAVWIGLPAAAAALLGGVLAASFLPRHLAALLLGLGLAVVPAAVGGLLARVFPFARIYFVPLGIYTGALLALGYLAVSWAVLCRGEPAGRGRILRGAIAMAVLAGVLAVVFLVMAPLAVRLDAKAMRAEFGTDLHFSPTGNHALVTAGWRGSHAWLYDTGPAGLVRYIPPPVWSPAWSADGSKLAYRTTSASLGRTGRSRIEVLDTRGAELQEIPFDRESGWMFWAGGKLLSTVFEEDERGGLVLIEPESGRVRPLVQGLWRQSWGIARPTEDGRVFVALPDRRGRPAEDREGRHIAMPYGLYEVDIEAGRVADEPILHGKGLPYTAYRRLSPSGRYWVLDPEPETPQVVRDLETGAEYPMGQVSRDDLARYLLGEGADSSWVPRPWLWLSGDRLVWWEVTPGSVVVRTALPGGEGRTLESFERDDAGDGRRRGINLRGSPGGSGAVISGPGPQDGSFLYVAETGEWRSLEKDYWAYWMAPGRIAWPEHDEGRLTGIAVQDLDGESEPRWLFGGPAD